MAKPRQLREKRGWAWAFCVSIVKPLLLLFTKRRWIDGEKVPAEGGCILVANHVSHLDPLTFAHFVYDYGRLPRFLAKSEVFDVPVVGTIIRSAGQIPVYRLTSDASQAFRAAVAAVDEGECVAVYPEGTISRDPGLWPMTGKTGAARIALSTGAPVVPIAQWGANESLRVDKTPSYGQVQLGFMHHTVSSNSYSASQVPGMIRGIYEYHVKANGWKKVPL